jgi:hypothetical protein
MRTAGNRAVARCRRLPGVGGENESGGRG